MKAEIRQTAQGYAIVWDGIERKYFDTVTAAQMYCQKNYIPFEPWGAR